MGVLSDKFELSRAGCGPNVRPMEGLRGFAVFLVFLVHYTSLSAPWVTGAGLRAFTKAIHAIGNTGVDLFFVLSGYLIYGSLMAREQGYSAFLWRRVRRIYPAFIVVFVLYVGLSLTMPASSKIPDDGAATYLLQNLMLLPGIFEIEPMISVAWSLSYEMLYYALLPLVIFAAELRRRSVGWRVGFFLAIAIVGLIYCALATGPVRLVIFISGILLYEAMKSRIAPPSSLMTIGALIAGVGFVGVTSVGTSVEAGVLFATFFVLCYRCFKGDSRLARAFSWTPLRWLGNMSYSYYLLHGLAIQVALMAVAKIMPTAEHQALFYFGMMPIVFAATLVPTAALFLLVERPMSLAPVTATDSSHRPSPAASALHPPA